MLFPGQGLTKEKLPSVASFGDSRLFISHHKRVNPEAHIPKQRWKGCLSLF